MCLRFLGDEGPRSPRRRSSRRPGRDGRSSRSRSLEREGAPARELEASSLGFEDLLLAERSSRGDGVSREEEPAEDDALPSPKASSDF